MANTQRQTGRIEWPFELTAAIRQHPPHGPAGAPDRGHQDLMEKLRDGWRRQLGQDAGTP
jgi:hypothetical protein